MGVSVSSNRLSEKMHSVFSNVFSNKDRKRGGGGVGSLEPQQ